MRHPGGYTLLVLAAALIVPSHIFICVQAWRGDQFMLGFLIALFLFWTAFALLVQFYWKRTLRDWHRTLDGWKETNSLVKDYAYLLQESLDTLSTWDRERVDDITERAQTITRLRANAIRDLANE